MKTTPEQIDRIRDLRAQGLGYNRIAAKTGINESTVRYWIDPARWQARNNRNRKRYFNKHPALKKLATYKARKSMASKTRDFQRRQENETLSPTVLKGFTLDDVLIRLGDNPCCYLTGRPIDLNEPDTYSSDHIIPICRGGTNSLENLGLVGSEVNRMKAGMTLDEFVSICRAIASKHASRHPEVQAQLGNRPGTLRLK